MPVSCPGPDAAAEVEVCPVSFSVASQESPPAGGARPRRRVSGRLLALAVSGLALLASGCGKQPAPAEVVRPVRLLQVRADAGSTALSFSGEVRPRVESRLGFRVAGKIAARLVDAGATVHRGQPLARLDVTDLGLAEAGARAQFDAAKTDRDLAASDMKRYDELFAKGFISAAEQHRRRATLDAAESKLRQAQASLRNQANQTGYGVLHADADGVVTAIDAEVGQVVSPGQSVIRVAQTAEKEVAIGLPEDQVDALRGITEVSVQTWAEPGRVMAGRVREIAGAADPVTRTYATRVSIPAAPADLKLGMTAVVTFERDGPAPVIRVPLTALYQSGGRDQVWIYEPGRDGSGTGTVRPVPVVLGAPEGNDVVVSRGLAAGQRVVTAGVHLLKPGQMVKPLQGMAPAVSPAVSPAAAPASAAAGARG
ncbi:efflux RND transporter periplasmic adaptor subunit [Cupriavidus malaysiensis]|uniref:Efflux transporter periplasmic adaptor subunit n=1 Tax=Cupriavidus malaysiensis TaxID=367825 RepID=A0ABN4TN60_9BURK|nr:efflux RND transporter periplasmic adaptor subunit [Cupriavidus malaysiensis]AOZ06443.1 efflux transporter periplasmic adaptor subunit [Cupriavidus malaysiensis]